MTPTETVAILRQFNAWIKGKRNYLPYSEEAVSEAIDMAVEMIKRMEKMEAALRIAVRQNSHDMLMTGSELQQCESALEKSK